ncbi:MAG: rhomboid family intramembrane serine protease [Bacteroidales bacterium]|nr:rhomboid family intramembrane serine protease [Bacteroidales bacterium]
MNTRLADMPPVVKNLIIINVLMFLAKYALGGVFGVDLDKILGLFFFKSPQFRPFQIVTHMFMHGSLLHLAFNMFALWMFGRIIESVWGAKRFFIYYFATGLGAALLQVIVTYIRFLAISKRLPEESVQMVINEGYQILMNGQNYSNALLGKLNLLTHIATIGASGAVFGVVLAFGMLFPNTQLMLMFPPIPIKAKYAAVLMLVLGIMLDFRGNVAHFAHLGGMIFGYILIRYWKNQRNMFY